MTTKTKANGEEVKDDATKQIAGKFEFHKSYARRRPDEPKSHYNARVKFIQALLKEEGHTITDEKVEVLSHCFSNVKYLNNKYPQHIMDYIARYDPTAERPAPQEEESKKRPTLTRDEDGKDAKKQKTGDGSPKSPRANVVNSPRDGRQSPRANPKTSSPAQSPRANPKAPANKSASAAAALAMAADDSDSD